MACSSGGCGKTDGGGCSSGGCNRINTYDWFADIPLSDQYNFNTVEISFKNGSRKAFFTNDSKLELYKGDSVVVEAAQGYDIGEVSMKGELVKLQMKRKNVKESADTIRKILRKASENDTEKLEELRASEREIMIKARVISRELNLDMKLGDVEYQGDGKKVTFYYTAENRIDFRDLVKRYVSEFKVKIEMRQIGARQEAGRIGGIGSCGRELCCSTWITDFQSVSTGAARYQQLSINTEKLSGQCGRLKCCLNYELDTYLDALKGIPKNSEKLKTQEGIAFLRKTDVFKGELTYCIDKTTKFYKLSAEDVKKILLMNKNNEKPASLVDFNIETITEKKLDEYEDLVGQVSLKNIEKKSSNNNRNKNKRRKNNNNKKGGNSQDPKPQ